jgi:hypothetical protein
MYFKTVCAINATCATSKTKKKMNEYRYKLEKSSKKYFCPECGKKRFVRYLDVETEELLPRQYGRCDREAKCSYHLNPYLDGYANLNQEKESGVITINRKFSHPLKIAKKKKPVYIPIGVFNETLDADLFEYNVFIQNLLARVSFPFESKDIEKVISLYYLGTISDGYRTGAITFPFIDIKNNVRAVQVKQFDNTNHTIATDYLHSIIERRFVAQNLALPNWLDLYNEYRKTEKIVSCLFGEHLLRKHPHNPIALVEAPKTAIYGALYYGVPERSTDLIWLAVYNKSSFTFDKLKVLQGRRIYVFPDLSKDGSTFIEWEQKATEFAHRLTNTSFIFSDLLEKSATNEERYSGLDFADYLIKLNWRSFRKQSIQCPNFHIVCSRNQSLKNNSILSTSNHLQSTFDDENLVQVTWNIEEIKKFFNNRDLPETVKLDSNTIITDVNKFVQSHIQYVENNIGNKTFLPYLERLQKLKLILSDFNIPEPDG